MTNRLPWVLTLMLACGFLSSAYSQVAYNFYFGDIHSHTWYSDGNQDQNPATYTKPVARAITYARTVATNMNYLGVSDHNHNESLNMTLPYWRSGHREADSVNLDGTFVGLYGQEWGTIGTGGHILIYGTDKLFGWNPGVYDVYVAKGDYTALYDSVRKYGGYMYLAHPNSSDFDGIFTGSYNALWDSVVQGTAIKSGPAFSTSTTESDPSSGNDVDRYNDLLKRGYHVAPIANQDNHNTNFGMSNQQRTVVLASSLAKADVNDALRNRRAYCSEDHNLKVEFEIGTHRMGELFSMSGSVPIRIKAIDPGESFTRIEIRYGIPGSGSVPAMLTSVTGRDSLVFSQPQPNNTTYYYYAYVLEADGHQAWTAPMWVTTTTLATPAPFSQTAPSNLAVNQPLSGTFTWQTSSGATGYDVYFDGNNPPTTLVSSNQPGTSFNYSGLSNSTTYFWKIVARNSVGTTDATSSPWRFTTTMPAPGLFSQTSPADASTGQPVAATLSWQSSPNATQYDVYLDTLTPPVKLVSSNQAGTTYAYSGLQNNRPYYWKIVAENVAGSVNATGSPWSFTTVPAPPGAFTHIAPAASATGVPVSGTLSWQSSSGATGYDVYFDTLTPPVTVVSSNQPGTSYSYSSLDLSRTYHWKIVAHNGVGSTDATSSPWSFTTIMPPPGVFSQTAPADAAIDEPIAGILSWQASPNATHYDVYLDTISPPVNLVSNDQAETTFAYSGLQFSRTYYWKISAGNLAGSIDAAGSPWEFGTMESNLPVAFTLQSPPNGSTEQLLGGLLVWNSSATATSYDVYLSTSAPPTVRVDSNLVDTAYAFSGLLPSTTYFWSVVARNVNGTTVPLATPFSFVTAAFPPAPGSLQATAMSGTAILLDWNDVAINENGYRVYRSPAESGPFTKVSLDMPAGSETYTDTGLQINQSYYYRVATFNALGEGSYSSITRATLAMNPGPPVVADVSYLKFNVTIDPALNPPATAFAIRIADSSGVTYVQTDGSTGAIPQWNTYAGWGGPTGVLVTGLLSCHDYTAGVIARNADLLPTTVVETPASTLCFSVTQNVTAGWNLISVPIDAIDPAVPVLFPASSSRAFAYEGGYVGHETVLPGNGYWLKFDAPVPVTLAGPPRMTDSIPLQSGWNIIGSVAAGVDVNSIVEEPSGIVTSAFFGYASGYGMADSILPVHGYWVKASSPGSLILNAAVAPPGAGRMVRRHVDPAAMTSIEFRDSRGRVQMLYVDARPEGTDMEMPPLPPGESFDVRFRSQAQVRHVRTDSRDEMELPIDVKGAGVPVTVTMSGAVSPGLEYFLLSGDKRMRLVDGSPVILAGSDVRMILRPAGGTTGIAPREYALEQNYPNPFNPSTVIRYSLPAGGYVSLKVFNLLGQEVASLVDGVQEAGQYAKTWDASGMPDGVYFYRLGSGSFSKMNRMTLLK